MYPLLSQVATADIRQLLQWNRFLPSPSTEAELEVMNAIVDLMSIARDNDNASFVAASKSIGW